MACLLVLAFGWTSASSASGAGVPPSKTASGIFLASTNGSAWENIPQAQDLYRGNRAAATTAASGVLFMGFYSYDGLGSVRGLTDAVGTSLGNYHYDAYGTKIEDTVSVANPYLFAGERFENDLGLYYLRARYLDVETGRFWTLDDWEGVNGESLTLHKYLYANANPISNTDPTGNASLSGAQAAAGRLANSLSSAILRIGNAFGKLFRKKRWNIWWVKTPKGITLEHTFIWAQSLLRKGRNFGYHGRVFRSDRRAVGLALIASRATGAPVPGALFLITPQRRMERLLGVKLPIERRKLSGVLGNVSFILWNIWAAQTIYDSATGAELCSYQRPFRYVTDVTTCKTWSEQAATKAKWLSAFPF